MNIIFLFIFIILFILLCMLINLFNKSYIGGSKFKEKSKKIKQEHVKESKHAKESKHTEEEKKYILNYMSEYYNDDTIKKRIIYILNSNGRYHNKNLGDIVIDTLNIIYFIYNYNHNTINITDDNICIGIEYITKKIKKYFPGRIMFIIKDKNTLLNNSKIRDKYKELSKKLKIYIYIAEKYDSQNAPSWKKPTWIIKSNANIHSLESRDDLAVILLSKKYKCPILSNDNYTDNYEYRATVAPFKLLEYNWFSLKVPIVRQYKPENYKTIHWSKTLCKLDNIFMPKELAIINISDSD